MALVVFLRGVNVGGHRTFRPSLLASQLPHLRLINVGAAGTFVVRRSVTQTELRAELRRRLPFDADIAICQGQDLLRFVSQDPFAGQPERPGIVRFVSVMSGRPRTEPSLPVRLPSTDEWLVRVLGRDGRFVYGLHRRHMKAIGQLGSLDRLVGVPVTTRSWTTIGAVVKVLRDGGFR